MKNQSGDEVFVPALGKENPAHDYRRLRDVIAEAGQSGTGNTVLRVGQEVESGGWTQTAYLVLSPAERERLIEALMEHRKRAPGDSVAGGFDADETEALVTTAGDLWNSVPDSQLNEVLSRRQVELAEQAWIRHDELMS